MHELDDETSLRQLNWDSFLTTYEYS